MSPSPAAPTQVGDSPGRAVRRTGKAIADSLMQKSVEARNIEQHRSNIKLTDAQASYYSSLANQVKTDTFGSNGDGIVSSGDVDMGDQRKVNIPGGIWQKGEDVTADYIAKEYGDLLGEIYGVSRYAKDWWPQFVDDVGKLMRNGGGILGDMIGVKK